MAKIIRPRYPVEISIGLLLLIFGVSFFLSGQLFKVHHTDLPETENVYVGMFLVSCAVIIMMLVLWEEFLFPIKVKPEAGEVVFSNHRSKLRKQLFIYCIIPVIFGFIYVNYEVNHVRFFIWAAICIFAPIGGKLFSGIKNYNDFLKLTDDTIEYKNNEKVGIFELKSIQLMTLVKDERNVLHKIHLLMTNNDEVTIDLDEMELEPLLNSIDKFITIHYKSLLKTTNSVGSGLKK